MGRRDAVQFTLEWAAEARRLGAIVEFEPGWETRGNGMTANYEGLELHHTAFLSSEANPFPAKSTLKDGRTDLGGPLANVGGPWCPDGAPRLVVIAAHPSNNAGASGGRNTAPLPVTSLFNPLVFALEIDYGGLVPMAKGQRKAATIFSRAGINVLRKSTDWIKAHAETSITGKWDPGFANGKTIDMGEFRQGVANFAGNATPGGFLMALNDDQQAELYNTVMQRLGGAALPIQVWDDLNPNPLIVERNGGKPREARGVQGDIYVHTVALLQQVAGLTAAVNALAAGAAGAGTTAEELRTVIREEMAKAIDVQVTVNGTSR